MENIILANNNINGIAVLSAKKIKSPRCPPLSKRLTEDRAADRRAAAGVRAKGIERPRRKLSLPEAELITLAERGDPDARWTLTDNYRGHIAERISSWNSNHESALTFEDKWSAATIGFLKGVDAYDPSTGHVLATITRFHIYAELNRAADDADPHFATRRLRQAKTEAVEEFEGRRREARNIANPITEDSEDFWGHDSDGETVPAINLVLDDEPDRNEFLERNSPHKIKIALDTLSDRDRRIIEARHLTKPPVTYSDLGGELRITSQRVNQLEQRAYTAFVSAVKAASVPEDEVGAEYLFKPDKPQYERWTRLAATPEELADLFARWADTQADVYAALQSLEALDRDLIEARFLRDPPSRLAEIARSHEISYAKTVSRIKRALVLLQHAEKGSPGAALAAAISFTEQTGNAGATL
jgi:DNA-directed RNA polymerase specialized sigma subunit